MTSDTFGDGLPLLLLLGIVALAALLGYFLALPLGWFVINPLYYARGLKNGASFREGDLVRVLIGAHRDRVVRVYEVWESRDQVRVELGEQERKDMADAFSPHQICRERGASGLEPPILKSNRARRVDFALFMVAALENDALVCEAPATVGGRTASALAHRAEGKLPPDNRFSAARPAAEPQR